MSATVTCPQCQAGLRITHDLSANQMVSCPHCRLKFVPPAASSAGDGGPRGSFLPWVLLAVVVGLGIGGVVWNRFANPNPEEKPADNKPAVVAQNSPNEIQQSSAAFKPESAAKKNTEAAPETKVSSPNPPAPSAVDPALGAGLPTPPLPKPMPKKAPKTYAESQQPLDPLPPPTPPVVDKKPPPEVKPPEVKPSEVKPPPEAAPKPPAVKAVHAKQPQINEAVDKGVAWLKENQLPNGTWGRGLKSEATPSEHSVGYTSFVGLTLLECGVPPDDPVVQKAAAYVRSTAIRRPHYRTYQMGSAILFLDRLSDKRDEPLIQAYALQIIAGQTGRGGWSYDCPELTRADMQQLLKFLQATRLNVPQGSDPLDASKAPNLNDPLKGAAAKADKDSQAQAEKNPGKAAPAKKTAAPPLKSLAHQIAAIPVVYHYYFKKMPPSNQLQLPVGPNLPVQPIPNTPMPVLPNAPLPLVPNPNAADIGRPAMREDNSNSQFAMLALWAARRHGVPTERVLLLAGERYEATQNEDGGWSYQDSGPFIKTSSLPTMTCVGLLGLAMAHASTPSKEAPAGKLPENPAIAKALDKLGEHIDARAMRDFYLLWSIERVAVLYDLKTLGNRDWYDVGVEMLLPSQRREGFWSVESYPGSTYALDTCFALLFLKRSDLVPDLTERLPFLMSIPDRTPRSR